MKKLFFVSLLSFSLFPLFAQETSQVDPNDYGGEMGLGFQILDGLTVAFRYYLKPSTVLQLDAGLISVNAPLLSDENGEEQEINIENGFGLNASVNFFGQRFQKIKRSGNHKIKSHGVAIRAGQVFGDYSSTRFTAGWVQEVFKQRNPKHSFLFELGLGAMLPHWHAGTLGQNVLYEEPASVVGTIYLRLHWNWFLK